MTPAFDAARPRYVSLATFRRDGREVRTPVWIAGDGRRLYVYTNAKSGKVKRVRANGRARLAACDARGRLAQPEAWLDARARLLSEPAAIEAGFAALLAKYGWQLRLALAASRVSGRYADRAILELEPT
jgi:PPOX class probable F420-dependent enzyme